MSDEDYNRAMFTRRGALKCLGAWSGAGIVWGLAGGIPRALGMANDPKVADAAARQFTFAQISDTHIGFGKEANPDVIGTLRRAIGEINTVQPAFVLHTGDITHLSKAAEFDQAAEVLKELQVDRIHYVPGEHDALDNGLSGYLQRYGRATDGLGARRG